MQRESDRLLDDDFFHGDPLAVRLWRVTPGDWSKLWLKVLPYSDGLEGRLPDVAKKKGRASQNGVYARACDDHRRGSVQLASHACWSMRFQPAPERSMIRASFSPGIFISSGGQSGFLHHDPA
jgi:hypothetical protein